MWCRIVVVSLSLALVAAAQCGGSGCGSQGNPRKAPGKKAAGKKAAVIKVPAGKAITLDGTLGKEEWAKAKRFTVPGKGEVLLLQDRKALYVGIRTPAGGIGSLGLIFTDRVEILHSSAALGSAVYKRQKKGWKLARGFSWKCRGADMSPRSVEDRKKYYADAGWLASVMPLGRQNEMEYMISRKKWNQSLGRLSVCLFGFAGPDPNDFLRWPATVEDGTADKDLLCGRTHKPLEFDDKGWARLDLGGAKPIPPLNKLDKRFRKKLAATDRKSVGKLLLLARWCKRRKLVDEARYAASLVLKLKPGHPQAQALLEG